MREGERGKERKGGETRAKKREQKNRKPLKWMQDRFWKDLSAVGSQRLALLFSTQKTE